MASATNITRRGRAPSCPRTSARRCYGKASRRGSGCAHDQADKRRGLCTGDARALLSSERSDRSTRCRSRTRGTPRALIPDAAAGDRAALTIRTVCAFARTFLADFAERWKPATRKAYAFNVRPWTLPAFGKRRVDAVGANCCHEILRIMFDCAIA